MFISDIVVLGDMRNRFTELKRNPVDLPCNIYEKLRGKSSILTPVHCFYRTVLVWPHEDEKYSDERT